MSYLVQTQVYEYIDETAGLIDQTYCLDQVSGSECPSAASECLLEFSFGGGKLSNEYLAMVYQLNELCISSDTDVLITYDGFGGVGNVFSLYVDDVLQWTTGCVTGSGSAYETIPANTRKVKFQVTGSCSGNTNDLWTMSCVCL